MWCFGLQLTEHVMPVRKRQEPISVALAVLLKCRNRHGCAWAINQQSIEAIQAFIARGAIPDNSPWDWQLVEEVILELGNPPPRRLEVHCRLSREGEEDWLNFYRDVVEPLVSSGAKIDLSLHLAATVDRGRSSQLVDQVRAALHRHDEKAKLELR